MAPIFPNTELVPIKEFLSTVGNISALQKYMIAMPVVDPTLPSWFSPMKIQFFNSSSPEMS